MECGHSEIDELIKEVSGPACPGHQGESGASRVPCSGCHSSQDGTGGPGLARLSVPAPHIPSFVPRAGAQLPLRIHRVPPTPNPGSRLVKS